MGRSVALNLIAAATTQGSTLAVNAVVANLLGQHAFGRYTIVLTTVAALATIGQLSMGYTATKHVAELRVTAPRRAERILALCGAVSVAAGLIAAVVLALSAQWLAVAVLESPDLVRLLRLSAVAVFFAVVTGFATGALAGLEGYAGLARTGIVSGALYLLLGVSGAKSFGLEGAVGGVVLSGSLQCVLLLYVLWRRAAALGLRPHLRALSQERAILLRFALPASLTGLVAMPAFWASSAMLARQSGYDQLALFGAANMFRTMVLFVPQAVNTVGMSLLNNQLRSSAAGYRRVFWTNASLTMAAACTAAAGLYFAGAPLLRLFGPGFDAAGPALAVLLVAAVVEALAVAVYQIVVSRGSIWASLLGVSLPREVTIVTLAAVLSARYGAVGLATAYAAGWTCALVGILVLVQRLGFTPPRMPEPAGS